MKRVAMLTTFYDTTTGYSLVTVTETLLRMLLDHGYEPPVVLVQDQFTRDASGHESSVPFKGEGPPSVWNPQTVDLRVAVPPLALTSDLADDFEDRVDRIQRALERHLDGVDVCITQDIILQDWYKEHNVAMRRYAETRPDLLWLHWIHSCPTPTDDTKYPWNCRYTPPPGYIVYPNERDRALVCRTYHLHGQEWRVKVCRAGHAIDPLLAWPYSDLTKDLVRQSDLLAGDIACVYPVRLDKGKQVEKIIRLLAGCKKHGYDPRLLICDWQSAGPDFQTYKDLLLDLARELGLTGKVAVSSRIRDDCSQGVPRRTVLELMRLCNVYVHPSRSETYSLVVHEAILQGNLVVLNNSFPAMRELFGNSALYMDFGSERFNVEYHPSEQKFWDDQAVTLIAELKQNRALQAKMKAIKQWSPKAQWREFEHLLYLRPQGISRALHDA